MSRAAREVLKEEKEVEMQLSLRDLVKKMADIFSEKKYIEEEKKVEGIVLPEIGRDKGRVLKKKESILKEIRMIYPLIPSSPGPDDYIYAYAEIAWNEKLGSLVYKVVEPPLMDMEKKLLSRIKEILEDKLDVDFNKLRKMEARKYLLEETKKILDSLEINLSPRRRKVVEYYIERDFMGLESIEPLMNDPNIEDISCDGNGIPIYIYHRNSNIGSIPTNIIFKDKDYLDSFVVKLAQRCGKTISMAEPVLDASLPDGSRLQATLSTDIARRGSNFTIRKFTEKPLTPVDLINFGTIDSRTLAYLWFAVEHRKSILVSGSTATGKTSMLNVISLFIKPEEKILTIEDTPELRLTNPHWVPEVAREAISEIGESKIGKVDMYLLLKESLRQRPDYIIVGEVRGKEAFVLFQQMATGHPGLSTIHAESFEKLIDRLTTPPINLPATLLENLDIIVFLTRSKYRDQYVRRVKNVVEVLGHDRERNMPITNEVFRWNPNTDLIDLVGGSMLLQKIVMETGITEREIRREIRNRVKVLEWMRDRGFTDYRDVGRIIKMYYGDKWSLLDKIKGESE
ncbi:MAG: type IV secretion system protein VirB11 [Candidatus Aenigmatarchaeota archaeon]|mgnify:CR=1 FL=1|nr:MAG: type IV secretion system protein VirB11 [Candidatus Aenigmarchaeota archaeon]